MESKKIKCRIRKIDVPNTKEEIVRQRYIKILIEDYGYDVLDGKQRLTTLIEYFTDSFKYKGKYFSELSFLDQYKITTN